MARRPNLGDEPVSRLAAWSRRLALFALVVAALSIAVVRSGLLEIEPALATFAAALDIRRAGGAAVVPGLCRDLAAGPVRARLGNFGIDPGPAAARLSGLSRLSRQQGAGDFRHQPPTRATRRASSRWRASGRAAASSIPARRPRAEQLAAYPDIVPLQVNAPVKLTYDVALALVTKRKWHVADARPPAPGRRDAVIEATARTPIMGFRDDVVIRVSPTGDGARVDIRSASRYGLYDFGVNAARIRSLLEDIDDAVGAVPEPRPEPVKKPPAKKAPARR